MTDIHTIVRQLTETHVHRQPYTFEGDMSTWDTVHVTTVPALLEQLAGFDRASEPNQGGTKAASQPAADIEAIDTLALIDLEASRWVRELGENDPADTAACVRKLYALAASAHFCGHSTATIETIEEQSTGADGETVSRKRKKVTCCTVHDIERDIRRWWTQARITSGWDMAAWKPNNTCPVCSDRRTLRIRSDDMTAMCTKCRETWDQGTIGILAEHVRLENGDEVAS